MQDESFGVGRAEMEYVRRARSIPDLHDAE
jgi:hypothetical protein